MSVPKYNYKEQNYAYDQYPIRSFKPLHPFFHFTSSLPVYFLLFLLRFLIPRGLVGLGI